MGLVSSLGNDWQSVRDSLFLSNSGIRVNESFIEKGLRSHISGYINCPEVDNIDRKLRRFMGTNGEWCHVAMQNAVKQADISQEQLSSDETTLIVGAGGVASDDLVDAINTLETSGIKRIGPYRVTREMGSAPSAQLATNFKIKGPSFSISSACATSAHCIGHGAELIQWGKQDIVFAGGGEEEHWSLTLQFDGMGALSTRYNDTPTLASRPYDQSRDGFVIAGGGAMLVLEEYEHAKARGAEIYAEVVGYAATSDGADMVSPSGEGASRCMQLAMSQAQCDIDYINAHGTSTPAGDITELEATANAFTQFYATNDSSNDLSDSSSSPLNSVDLPPISSTKSLSGHSLGAAGVQEAIYCLLMMKHNFIVGSANIEDLDEGATQFPIITGNKTAKLGAIMSNSFGFGGTNASLIFKSVEK